ncbi:MAG: asparagine synthase (glutamine-hydrolyzing) [Planctomycetota bacterium]
MCGIAGILYRDPEKPVEQPLLQRMGDAIAHRGPDAEGFYSGAGVGLVHRRLSIIDLAGGGQPIGNEDGSIQVVFNGEIYNFLEIRAGLQRKGHVFRTRSDTEVLVHLYEEEGADLVSRLRGMFAFAIWDSRKRMLLLARDRIGLKPLYVCCEGDRLLFGSEIKALLACPGVDRSIDPAALEDYLAFGMIPGERSIFRSIHKLPAAHVLVVRQDEIGWQPRRYWQLQVQANEWRTIDGWRQALEAKAIETVKAHQIADVPVGAFLSGGLDSSIAVALQSELSGAPVQTFSIGFREEHYSELPFARLIAEQFGTDHTEEIVSPRAAGMLDDLVHYYDEPFADSSAIPTLCVSRLARSRVKVAISGDGGDECFGGYARYAHDLREAAFRQMLPRWLRRGAILPIGRAWPKADWLPRVLRAKTLLTNLGLESAEAYANTLALVRLPARRRLLSGDVRAQLNGYSPEAIVRHGFLTAPAGDTLAGMIAADVNVLLPDDFLTKVDRASMACGLEVRPPFVDHELLELASSIPSSLKIRNGQTKWLLKETFRDRLPDGFVNRPKQGFEIPVDAWLRGPLREIVESSVLSPRSAAADLIDQSFAARLFQQHLTGTGRHGGALWALLVLAHWAERYCKLQVHTAHESAHPVRTS